jgi:antitoxin CptB
VSTDITTHEARLRKLRFRAWHRGFREADLIVGPFADHHVAGFDADQLEAFERLLEAPDQDLYEWIVGRQPVPSEHQGEVMERLRAFRFTAHTAGDPARQGA